MRYFSRSHRCVTFSARGYPPSDVPSDPARYGQDIVRGDVIAIMDALGIAKAHIVGHSMGAYTALHIGMRHPERCISVTAAGCGWGSVADPATREAMRKQAAETAQMFLDKGMAAAAALYADNPTRLTQKYKDPRGYAEFARMLSEHSAQGHALTMSMLQARAADLVGPRGGFETIFGAAAGYRRRRGRYLSRRQRFSQTYGADSGSPGHTALGSHRHQRGTRRSQCGAGGLVCGRRSRPLARTPGAGVKAPSHQRPKLFCVVKDDAECMALSGTNAADAVTQIDAISALRALHRPVVNGE